MIPATSTIQRKPYNRSMVRIGVEALKVGDYIRTVNLDNGDYNFSKVISIAKVTLAKYEVKTTCFDTIICSSVCKFMCLDGLPHPWTVNHSFNHSTRLLKRDASKLLTPFIKTVKKIGTPHTFYSIVIEDKDQAVLVDGYAKVIHE